MRRQADKTGRGPSLCGMGSFRRRAADSLVCRGKRFWQRMTDALASQATCFWNHISDIMARCRKNFWFPVDVQAVRVQTFRFIAVLFAVTLFFLTAPQKSGKAQTAYAEETLPQPVLCYDFEGDTKEVLDKAGGNDAVMHGRTVIRYVEERDSQALYLSGKAGAYMELPKGFFDGRDTMTISMDVCSEMNDENFFTLAIGQDDRKYLFLRSRRGQMRYALTANSYGSEQDVAAFGDFYGVWTNVTLVLAKQEMRLYINGELADVQTGMTASISSLGTGTLAYLGKSFYSGDAYFKGYIDNFKVYGEALSALEIAELQGICLKPFRDITADDWSLVTWQADTEKKEAVVYISRSNSHAAEKVSLRFVLQENAEVKTAPAAISFDVPLTVEFIVEKDGRQETEQWTVRAVSCANPVLAGQYADPDIDVFDGKYYLYATTDGFSGWSGTQFHVFSSENLVDWEDGGVILDVASAAVPWAVGSAWAPSIEEKNGKYYFYFCAKSRDGVSSIGVAVADTPAGPFTAEPEPLMTKEMCDRCNVSMGQAIDPSIFTDEDGTSYLLFGNGGAAVVRLNDDMVSVDLSTLQNYRGVREFREAITVTKRDGLYHFTWSCDDTGSTEYHVNYGISENLYGPIVYQYTLLAKDTASGILGTGHHCILQIPGKEEYYIAYHRFFTPLGFFTEGLGFHRETCIDRLEFDAQTGRMLPVKPTLQGVAERRISGKGEDGSSVSGANGAVGMGNEAAGGLDGTESGKGNENASGSTGGMAASGTDKTGNGGSSMEMEGVHNGTEGQGKLKDKRISHIAGILLAVVFLVLLPLCVAGCRKAAKQPDIEKESTGSTGTGSAADGDGNVPSLEENSSGTQTDAPVYTDYIFAYFTGNGAGQEAVSFAVSRDGFSWKELNHGKPLLKSELGTKGVRDPFLIRSVEGDKFYLLATDLCIAADGDWWKAQTKGSTSIIIWESEDLIHWSEPRMVKINSDQAGCTWAPEAFYDESSGEYLVFFASRSMSDNYARQRVFYVKTTDFVTFTEPVVWIDYDFDTIDTTVIREGDVYYRFTKYEGEARVILERSDVLLGEWTRVESESLNAQEGVEGPCCFALNEDDVTDEYRYVLLLDNYGGSGYYMQTSISLASGEFKKKLGYSLPKKRPRHGTVIPITSEEYDKIMENLQ